MSKADDSKDYVGSDGLLYCGICGKHRQLRIDNPLLGQRIVTTMCLCDEAEKHAHNTALDVAAVSDKVRRLRQIGLASPDYEYMTFSADDGLDGKSKEMRAYVDNWQESLVANVGLLFYGPVDGGKTFWAASIVNALIDKGVSAMITTVPNLVAAMRDDFEGEKQSVLEKISTVSFLVLDDVGYERRTQYADEKLFEIIDARYRSRRPLIVTTNLTPQEMVNPSDMAYRRAFGRIIEMCTPIFFPSMARRVKIAKEKAKDAHKIMGERVL